MSFKKTEISSHTQGTRRGEAQGEEPGRDGGEPRTSRDSTSINPGDAAPIDPRMPEMPPA
ncbi:MAG: hypothetical protein ABI718_10410 [Acidobacteriota bacterium]